MLITSHTIRAWDRSEWTGHDSYVSSSTDHAATVIWPTRPSQFLAKYFNMSKGPSLSSSYCLRILTDWHEILESLFCLSYLSTCPFWGSRWSDNLFSSELVSHFSWAMNLTIFVLLLWSRTISLCSCMLSCLFVRPIAWQRNFGSRTM